MESFAIISIILSLLMTCGWTIFNFSQKILLWLSLLLIAVILAISSTVLITNVNFISFIITDTFSYPMICVWMFFFGSVIFNFFDVKGKNVIFSITFGVGLLSLLFGFELLKISLNTWKGLLPAMAYLQILTSVLILQTVTYFSSPRYIYGILKLLAGITSFAIIILQNVNLLPYIRSDADVFFGNLIIFATTGLIIEGLLIMYKAKKVGLT